MKWFMKVWMKFVSYDTLVKIIATALALVLEYARKHSDKGGWEKAKKSVHEVKKWVNLFDEVYEDDTLTEEEEQKIEDAIADCTGVATIYKILLNKKSPKKANKKPAAKKTRKTNSTRGKDK